MIASFIERKFNRRCLIYRKCYQKKIDMEATKNMFNRGSREKMTYGEMKKLPTLLDLILNHL